MFDKIKAFGQLLLVLAILDVLVLVVTAFMAPDLFATLWDWHGKIIFRDLSGDYRPND